MPLPLVHLAVARKLEEIFPMPGDGEKSAYYAGSLAPDAIHMRPDTNRDDKTKTHLNVKDLSTEEDMASELTRFLKRENPPRSVKAARAFNLGYVIHLMTDYYWFKQVFPDFRASLPEDCPDDKMREIYYHDTDHVDSRIYHTVSWQKEVYSHLKEAEKASESLTNSLIAAHEVLAWTSRIHSWFDDGRFPPETPTPHLRKERIDAFIDDTARVISEKTSPKDLPLRI